MKKLLIPAALVAVILFGMPYVTGRVAESVTQQLTQQLNANSFEYGELALQEYERGFGSTSALLEWQAPAQYKPLFDSPIVYRCQGDHGITSFSYQCQAQNVPNYTEFVAEYLNGEDPIVVGGEVSVFGAATQTIKVKPFTVQNDAGDSFEVQAGKVDIATDQSLEAFNIFGQFGGFTMTAADDVMSIAPAEVIGDLRINQHNLAIGEVGITFEGLELKSNSDGELQFGEIQMRSRTSEQGKLMTMDYALNVDSFNQNGGSGKDAQAVNNIELELGVSGLDMAELAEITERLQQISQFDSGEALSNEQESNRNAQALAMLPELEDLLATGLKMRLDLAADYAGEPLTADAKLELLKDLSLGDFILLSVQPQAFFNKLDLKFNNRLPTELIETNEAGAVAMANNSFYEKSGKHYETALSVSGDGIELNGQKLSVEEFLSKLSAQ